MEVIRITNEEPFAATKIDWWPPWWAVLPHYLSNLFISLWNNFRAKKSVLLKDSKRRTLEISVAGISNFEIVPVNCIIIGIFPRNSEESSSRNQFKLDLLLDLSPLLPMEKRFLSSGKFFGGKVGSCQCHHSEKQLPAPPLSLWIISKLFFYQSITLAH